MQVLQNKSRSPSSPQLGPLYDQLPLTPEPYVRESNRSSVRHPVRKSEFTLHADKESGLSARVSELHSAPNENWFYKIVNICSTLSRNMETRFSLTVFVIISCLLLHFSVTCVGRALKNLQSKGVQIFQKSIIQPKISGYQQGDIKQFYTVSLQTIGVAVLNVFGMANWRPIFVQPCLKKQ